MRRWLLVAAVATCVTSSGTGVAAAAERPVGHRIERIGEPDGPRKLSVHLWYPANAADWETKPKTSYSSMYKGVPLPGGFSALSWSFDAELAHENAAVAAGGTPLPVIVFSHGSVNDPINSAHLLERIAADGFIVAAPTHVTDSQEDVRVEFITGRLGAAVPETFKTCPNGQPRATQGQCSRPNNSGQARMVERHADLVKTLDALPGWLGDRADMTRVGVLGHSRGTLTGMTAAAGAPAAWSTEPRAPATWTAAREPRVKAVMGMASGGAQAFTLSPNLAEIDIPTLLVAGGLDTNSSLEINRDLFNQIGCEPAVLPVDGARPTGCANPKASKEFVVLDQAHHRTFIGTFCDQTRAVGTIAKADPNAIFEVGALTGANGAQYLTQTASGRAMDYCSPDTFTGWEDLVRSTTALTAAGGFCITPASVDPGTPCNELRSVPTTGLDEETVKAQMTRLAIGFFTDKLHRDRDGDGSFDTADNCLTVANPDQHDDDRDGDGNACDATPYGTTPPTLTVPGAVTGDATGPTGAAVTFAATAVDDLDGERPVTCAPASGSTFAIGTVTVECTASDRGGNTSAAQFRVTVLGAGAQLSNLVVEVVGATNLSPAIKTQLTAVLQSLVAGFDPAKPLQRAAACLSLRTFATVVRVLAPTHAAEWTADANRIRAVLAC